MPNPEREQFNRKVVDEFRSNKGNVGGQFKGAPMIIVTHTGAKSGKSYTTPLVYTKDGDRYVIIASKAGAPTNPDWYHNLKAHPEVTLEVGTEKFKARAKEVTGAERDRLYKAQADMMPFFNDYAKKAGRVIPVFVLERVQ
jgi:deazaflavin-dependent oxidoreductase (nitroreductase family)